MPTSEGDRELWLTVLDLAERSNGWTLIGARMVELHATRAGRTSLRTSKEADVLADARRRPNPVRGLARILVAQGFEMVEPSAMGVGHAFTKGDIEIDVLAPEGLGVRSENARITIPPIHTVEVPGGTQALKRTERVAVRVGKRTGEIPRPNLLGAILLKARAVEVDDAPANQRSDLALLLSLVDDPVALSEALTKDEKQWLRERYEINEATAACWRGLSDAEIQRGLSTFRILSTP